MTNSTLELKKILQSVAKKAYLHAKELAKRLDGKTEDVLSNSILTIAALGAYKIRKEDFAQARQIFRELFFSLCQPRDEEVELNWSFRSGHPFWEMAENVNITQGWGLELEAEELNEILYAFEKGQNPLWVARELGHQVERVIRQG